MVNIIEELSLKEIGERIKVARESRRMTMIELGMNLGRPTRDAGASYVKHLENGTRKTLKESELEGIIGYFGISKEEFIELAPLDKAKHTDINPLYIAVPGIEDLISALGLAQRMGDPAMGKIVLGHIKDQIEKSITP